MSPLLLLLRLPASHRIAIRIAQQSCGDDVMLLHDPFCAVTMSSTADSIDSSAPSRMDGFAIALSGLCLVHCLIIPVAVVLVPALSSVVLGTETTVHWVFLTLAVPTSCWALLRGFRRRRKAGALLAGMAGLLLMFLGVSHLLDPGLEVPLTLVGVSMVVVAHVLNLRRTASAVLLGR